MKQEQKKMKRDSVMYDKNEQDALMEENLDNNSNRKFRKMKIMKIRRKIANGSYKLDKKMDAVLEKILCGIDK